MIRKKFIFLVSIFFLVFPPPLPAESNLPQAHAVGIASWYSESDPGINLHTANGEIFDDTQRTCASWNFPFGTLLRVTSLKNGKSVVCRVNDRGPAKRLGRLIDLTSSAFRQVAPLKAGLIQVKVEPLPLDEHIKADDGEQNLHQDQKGLVRDPLEDFFGHIRAQAHYQTEA